MNRCLFRTAGVVLVGLLLRLVFPLIGAEDGELNRPQQVSRPEQRPEQKCSDCHTCSKPTKENPCLAPCPRLSADEGPEVVLLDQLSVQYVPVIFAHKLHAQMTEMAGGCELCHHHNPPGAIRPCRDCHSAPDNPPDLRQPGLKGAYHRQCLNCHREWSHETECAVCHAKKTAHSLPVVVPDPTDIMGILHPNVKEPETKTYETKHERGNLVTFRHSDHVHRFGFKCVSCHREETCNRCHSPGAATPSVSMIPVAMTAAERHRRCASCHDTSNGADGETPDDPKCARCHSDRPLPPFDHAVTGLVLDKDHRDVDCFDCHLQSMFKQPPSCGECHEKDITFPAKLPGRRIEKQ